MAVAAMAGCGSSKHSSSGAGTASGSSTTPASATATVSTTSTHAQSSAATTTSGGSAPAGSDTTGATNGGATNVRVPATFTIRKGPALDPPIVSVPAFIAIQLTLISGDGAMHRVVVLASSKHTLTVPAHGRASVLLPGLKAGRYVIYVDGSGGGALLMS